MTLAMEREQTAYRSHLHLAGAVLADPEPSSLRLVRGCIAVPFTADVRAVASRDRLADDMYMYCTICLYIYFIVRLYKELK